MLFLREPKLILTLTVFFYELKAGLLDPDPHSFLLLDLDPEGKNCQIKTGKNARKLVIISEVNLNNLHCFLHLSNLLCLLQQQKTLHKVIFLFTFLSWIRIRIFYAARSGSPFIFADPDLAVFLPCLKVTDLKSRYR